MFVRRAGYGGRLQVHFPVGNQAQVPGDTGKVRSHLPSTRRFLIPFFVSPRLGKGIRQLMLEEGVWYHHVGNLGAKGWRQNSYVTRQS